jgi:hypothetical protein
LLQCDQVAVSLKMSRDISALGFPTCCKTWQEWVTERRGAWRQRVNAARLTRGRESLSWLTISTEDACRVGSAEGWKEYEEGNRTTQARLRNQIHNWPTVCASEVRQGFQDRSRGMKGSQESLTTAVVKDAANWPTPQANEIENPNKVYRSPTNAYRGNKKVQPMLADVCKHGQAAPASSSSLGSRQGLSWPTARSLDGQINESLESWTARRDRKQAEGINLHRPLPIAVMQEQFPTPRTCDWKSSPNADSNIKRMEVGQATLAEFVHAKHKKGDLWSTPRTGATESSQPNNKGGIPLADQAKREHRNWATPQTFDHVDLVRTPEKLAQTRAEKNAGCMNLREQVHYPEMDHSRNAWGTPTARDHKSGRGNEDRQYKELTPMVERQQSGKLNPRWVETLMGLPIGWTMPSCTSPQTIAPMSCDSSAMELCLPPQSGPFEFSLAS